MVNNSIKLALIEFIKHIEKELYFQAHEILEEVWHIAKKTNHPQTLLIKGLINASISFAHIKRARVHAIKASQITIKSYYRYRDMNMPSIDNYEFFNSACGVIETHEYMDIVSTKI